MPDPSSSSSVQFANPSGLWLALALVPLLLLYLLRGRPARVRVSSLLLWRSGASDERVRRIARVSLPEPSAWLVLLALAFVSLAVAGPGLPSPSVKPRLAIIIDASASMQSLEPGGRERIELAKDAAREAIGQTHPDADIALVVAGRAARLAIPFGAERSALNDALSSVQAEDCEGELSPAIALAREQLERSLGERRLLLLTDGAFADPLAAVPNSSFERTVRVGTPQVNTAIVHLEVTAKPPVEQAETFPVDVLVTLQNFGLGARTLGVRLHQRNVEGVLAEERVQLGPGAVRVVALRFQATPADQGSGIWVELTPSDALPIDDRAFAVVPLYAKQPVVVVAKEPNPWLLRALQADRGVALSQVSPSELERVTLPPAALLVYSGFCPARPPPGSFVVIAPGPGTCFDVVVGAEMLDLRFTHWDEQDLRFRFAELDDVYLTRGRSLLPRSNADAIAWSHATALISKAETLDRDGTILGFDIADSNWPFQASFVLFVRNLVELAKGPLGPGGHATQTGQTLSISVPSDASMVTMVEPGPMGTAGTSAAQNGVDARVATPLVLAARDGRVLLPPLTRAGFYHLSWQGNTPGSLLAAASLLSPRESDPAQRDVPTLEEAGAIATQIPPHRFELRPWLAAIALLLLGLEAVLATRRRAAAAGSIV